MGDFLDPVEPTYLSPKKHIWIYMFWESSSRLDLKEFRDDDVSRDHVARCLRVMHFKGFLCVNMWMVEDDEYHTTITTYHRWSCWCVDVGNILVELPRIFEKGEQLRQKLFPLKPKEHDAVFAMDRNQKSQISAQRIIWQMLPCSSFLTFYIYLENLVLWIYNVRICIYEYKYIYMYVFFTSFFSFLA